MNTEDQRPVIAWLADPATHHGAAVERIDTHTAVVFLAGDRAWKLKRAVQFDYVDFGTAPRRRAMCEAEVQLNRRTAPALYRGVVPVTRERDGSLALGGRGTPVDWLVEMARFDQAKLFDRMAARGALDLGLMEALGDAVAALHGSAQVRRDHGGGAGMAWVIDGNAEGFAEFGRGFLDHDACAALTAASHRELARQAPLLDARRDTGAVRQCHGDLHLRNIVLLDDRPTLFDAIEFNDELACIDVLYDLAFLLMDLGRRSLPRHANVVWNRYLAVTGDLDGASVMPLFLSCRAAVRAKTGATAASMQADEARAAELRRAAREYLSMAQDLLRPAPPVLVAVGGVSGTGKSTVAAALAPLAGPPPGAVVMRSDEIRKALCNAPRFARLGPEGYSPAVSALVYATMLERTRRLLRAGASVIIDAASLRERDREAIAAAAADAGAAFAGLWLEAPLALLAGRLAARQHDPSDADVSVLRTQAATPLGTLTWPRLDASQPRGEVLRAAIARLRGAGVPIADAS